MKKIINIKNAKRYSENIKNRILFHNLLIKCENMTLK